MYRSLGVVSDKIASAKRNPVQTGNTTTTTLLTYLLTSLLTHSLTYLLTYLLLLLLLLLIIMGDARVRVKEKLESWAPDRRFKCKNK